MARILAKLEYDSFCTQKQSVPRRSKNVSQKVNSVILEVMGTISTGELEAKWIITENCNIRR